MTEENKAVEKKKQDNNREELIRTGKFVLFSISAGLIEIGSFELLNLLTPWDYWVKHIISIVLSVIWNFTLNREFTFRSASNVPVAMLKVALFYAVFIPVTTILGDYLVKTCGWNDTVVKVLTMLLNFVTEYLYDRFFVFGKSTVIFIDQTVNSVFFSTSSVMISVIFSQHIIQIVGIIFFPKSCSLFGSLSSARRYSLSSFQEKI